MVEEPGKPDEYVVDRPGMTAEEICAEFPPHRCGTKHSYNRLALLRGLILEAHQEGEPRERKNVRGFWYERLFYTFGTVLAEPLDDANRATIDAQLNEAWRELIEGGYLTYVDLNIYSERERMYRVQVREDSPYPTCIVIVEKDSYYDKLQDISDTFEISFCSTRGQNSRAAAMSWVKQLQRLGIDTMQAFTVFSFTDLDPEGWHIPVGFVNHLGAAGVWDVELIRVGVLPGQIGESVLEHQAVLYSLAAKTALARKAKQTKYDNFVRETGGVFNSAGQPVRVEMNVYSAAQIRDKILRSLAEHIEGFPYQVRPLKDTLESEQDKVWSDYWEGCEEDVNEVYQPYYDAIEEERQALEIARIEASKDELAEIAGLQDRIDEVRDQIREKTVDVSEKEWALKGLVSLIDIWANDSRQEIASCIKDYPSEDDLVARIEQNGGWRSWAEELRIEIVGPEALVEAANRHRRLDWNPDQTERGAVRDWIADVVDDEAVFGCPAGPSDEPRELIEQALSGKWSE